MSKENMTEEIKKDKKKKVTKTVSKRGEKKPATKASRIFRGPLFWIVFAIIAVSVFGQISGAGSAFTKVNTSQILDAIAQSEVKSATVVDRDQKIQVELKSGFHSTNSNYRLALLLYAQPITRWKQSI
jgi:cell division protease FtsH